MSNETYPHGIDVAGFLLLRFAAIPTVPSTANLRLGIYRTSAAADDLDRVDLASEPT